MGDCYGLETHNHASRCINMHMVHRFDALWCFAVAALPCTVSGSAEIQSFERRCVYPTEHRLIVDDQTDHHGILTIVRNVLLCAVDRVDEPGSVTRVTL